MPKPDQCTMALKATTNTLSAKPIQIKVVSMSVPKAAQRQSKLQSSAYQKVTKNEWVCLKIVYP